MHVSGPIYVARGFAASKTGAIHKMDDIRRKENYNVILKQHFKQENLGFVVNRIFKWIMTVSIYKLNRGKDA